jgi:hypothetical protein
MGVLKKLGLKKDKKKNETQSPLNEDSSGASSNNENPIVERDDEYDDSAAFKAVYKLTSGVESIEPTMYQQRSEEQSMLAMDVTKRASKIGWMIKRGGSYKSWKKRFFVVVNRYVYYFPDEEKSLPLGHVRMERANGVLRADDETGKDNSFKIITQDRVLYCACESEQSCSDWMTHLQATVNASLTKEVLTKGKLQGYVLVSQSDQSWIEQFCVIHNCAIYFFESEEAMKPEKEMELKGAIVKRMVDHTMDSTDATEDSQYVIEVAKLIDGTTGAEKRTPDRKSFRKSFGVNHAANTGGDTTNFFNKLANQVSTSKDYIRFKTLDEDSLIWEKVLQDEVDDATNSWASNNALMKGWLYRRVAKNSKEYNWMYEFFVLSSTHLYVFESEESRESTLKVNIVGRMITKAYNETRRPFSFKIESTETLFLSAQTDDECECWVEELKETSKTTVAHAYTKSGWLVKQGGSIKSWKTRFCVLKGTYLYYFKDPSDGDPKGSIKLAGQMIRHLTVKEAYNQVEKENVLQVYTSERTWYLYADHEQDAIDWAIVLRKAALLFRGKTIEVDASAKTNKSTDGNVKYKTIQEAVVKANDMDRILIKSGTYNEQVTVKKSLIIEGIGEVIIQCKSTPIQFEAPAACKVSNLAIYQIGEKETAAVCVKQGNIMLEHCEISAESGCGIEALQECQITLNNCQVHKCKLHGIWLKATSAGLFEVSSSSSSSNSSILTQR